MTLLWGELVLMTLVVKVDPVSFMTVRVRRSGDLFFERVMVVNELWFEHALSYWVWMLC